MRAPSDYSASAYSQNGLVVTAMNQLQPALKQRISILFQQSSDFVLFSNKRWMQVPNQTSPDFDSLESIHDSVHMACGQNGHFEYVEYSGFDPIFFLHHAMVDRLLALWQIMYPNSWVEALPALEASYTTAAGEIEDVTTPLTPFHSDGNGRFWDSNMCRDTVALSYGYEDMMLGLSSNKKTQREMVIASFNNLYGNNFGAGIPPNLVGRSRKGGSSQYTQSMSADNPENSRVVDWHNSPDFSHASLRKLPSRSSVIKNNYYVEWLANIRVQAQALSGPFSVYLFFGAVPEDIRTWRAASNLVGTYDVFAMTPSRYSPTSQYEVSGSVPMTHAVMRVLASGILQDTSPGEVELYLQRSLAFRVATPSKSVDPNLVRGLSVGVYFAHVKISQSQTELPQWGPLTKLYQVFGTD